MGVAPWWEAEVQRLCCLRNGLLQEVLEQLSIVK